ncbi:MAG: nucleotidyltransferase domain-containing protein [Candidatus Cloacimonetes bacterium]|nr:nucleotidyltransferase domain-containing protein [Candidatus Cloacimonadota bacterium]MBL7086728.1 nucleotidyltransferase domain-containing protein [Candidatus Cloacimonadota bacterium]
MVTKRNLDKIIADFISALNELKLTIDKMYLFGSYANNTEKEYSDIDIAIVSKDFQGIRFFDIDKIIDALLKADNHIEPHPFAIKDFTQDNPFAKEIMQTGKRII